MEKPTKNIRYDKAAEALYIIDQTLLPGQEREIRLETLEQMYDAIKLLRVRAPRPSGSARPTACMFWPGASKRRTLPRLSKRLKNMPAS